MLELGVGYASVHLPASGRTVVLQCMGKTWEAQMVIRNGRRWFLNGGWSKFAHDSGLGVDDICLFELKKNKRKLTMKVYIISREEAYHEGLYNFVALTEHSRGISFGKHPVKISAKYLPRSWHERKSSRRITFKREVGHTKNTAPYATALWKLVSIWPCIARSPEKYGASSYIGNTLRQIKSSRLRIRPISSHGGKKSNSGSTRMIGSTSMAW